MISFFGKNKFPELTEHLVNGERVLAIADHSGGKIYVTNFALLSFDHHDRIRIPWELTLFGKWDEPVLTVSSQADSLADPQIRGWQIVEPGFVPEAVRDRITGAQVFDQIKEIPEVGKVRFLARKGPAGVTWTTLLDGKPVSGSLTSDSQTHIANEIFEFKKTLGI